MHSLWNVATSMLAAQSVILIVIQYAGFWKYLCHYFQNKIVGTEMVSLSMEETLFSVTILELLWKLFFF